MSDWRVSGTYFEGVQLRRDLSVSPAGRAKTGRSVVLAGSYSDDEAGRPWRVCLYIDEAATDAQHAARRWFIRADEYVVVRAGTPVASDLAVSCGIPGHDHPGEEVCGFATDFDYRSDR